MEHTESITKCLQEHPRIKLGILYGSVLNGSQTFESDIDVAVAGEQKLSAEEITRLIEEITNITGRPVDLVDLQATHGTLLKQILTKGEVIYKEDTVLYANILKRMLFADADFMPYYYRILKERRERWINE